MDDVTKYYLQAELSLASYSELEAGTPNVDALRDDDRGLSAKQAELFAQKYSVIAQYNDTVFKDNDTGQLTLALRGTEIEGKDLSTDASIWAGGAGYDQIVALYNWWSRVTARPGDPVLQYRLVGVSSNPQAVQVGSQWLEPADTVIAVGGDIYNAVDLDSALEITGHSLGGHLAMAFSTLFAGFTTEVTVFNAPGFKDNFTNQDFFAALGGSVPTGTKITNVIAGKNYPQAASHSLGRIAA